MELFHSKLEAMLSDEVAVTRKLKWETESSKASMRSELIQLTKMTVATPTVSSPTNR